MPSREHIWNSNPSSLGLKPGTVRTPLFAIAAETAFKVNKGKSFNWIEPGTEG